MKKLGTHFNRLGFTLIELMVAVGIIGVLVAGGLVAFRNSQQTARDARRRSDVDSISKALEQFYNNTNAYPAAIASIANATYFVNAALPLDPLNVAPSTYTTTTSALTYCVCALMERTTRGNSSSTACAYVPTGGATATHFCMSAQQ